MVEKRSHDYDSGLTSGVMSYGRAWFTAGTLFNALVLALLLSLLFVFGTTPGYGQETPQAVFDQANEQLQSGDYAAALSLYQQLEQQQTVSGALFMNTGLTYQRMDSLGKAKYYYLKASRFDEAAGKARDALEQLESQFSRQSAILPQLPWDRATNWLQHTIGATALLAIGVLLLNIGILIFASGWFVRHLSKYLNTGGLIVVGLSLLFIAASFYTQYVADRYSTAVMVTEKESVRERPASDASLVSQAYEGYAFTIDHQRSASHSNWSYVRMSNGLYGWIPDSEILVL